MRKGTTEGGEGQAGVWRKGLEEAIRERVREVIEEILHEEVEEALGAGRSQGATGRCGYRHGKKARRLTLRAGTLKLAVPRARLVNSEGAEREWRSQLLPRYRRSSPEVEQAVLGVKQTGEKILLAMAMMVWSHVGLSASLVMQVCRRSWNRILRPARVKAARHADRQDLIGLEGSILSLPGFSRSIPAASQAGNT